MSKKNRIILIGVCLPSVCLALALWIPNQPAVKEVWLSTFYSDLKNGQILEIVVRGCRYTYKRNTAAGVEEVQTTGIEPSQTFNKALVAQGIIVGYQNEKGDGLFLKFLVAWFPLAVALVAIYFFMRQSGTGVMQRFGRSKARRIPSLAVKVTFDNVAGIDEARDELKEIIAFLNDGTKFQRLGGRIPRGVLLMGPPGTGKTLLARAIAGEAGVPFFSISGSDFMEIFTGVGASRVRELFAQAKRDAPCIIFIDELDAVGRRRGTGPAGGHDEREQTLNQLLVEMDGFESNNGVIILAATNRPDVLDPALTRPGRFDRIITIFGPDVRGREGILAIHTKRTPMDSQVSLPTIARGTPGFSGADLENLVNEAALLAARAGKDLVEEEDFEGAKDKVLMGVERRSMIIGALEKRIIAFHEAGHALTARLVSGADSVHKVTIVPRGDTLGLTQQLPVEDRSMVTQHYAKAQIAVLLGGRIAEEIVIKEVSSGAGKDILKATRLAHKMVREWGMSRTLGPLHYGQKEGALFLGRRRAGHRNLSTRTGAIIDEEVQKIIMIQYKRARALIESNLAALTGLAEKLLEMEVLAGAEVDDILKKHGAKGEVGLVYEHLA